MQQPKTNFTSFWLLASDVFMHFYYVFIECLTLRFYYAINISTGNLLVKNSQDEYIFFKKFIGVYGSFIRNYFFKYT